MRKFLAILNTIALSIALLVGYSAPATASTIGVTFPSGTISVPPNEWVNVASHTGVTPAITGVADPATEIMRATISTDSKGKLYLGTVTGLTADTGLLITTFDGDDSTQEVITFTGTVNALNASLATLHFKSPHAANTLRITVNEGSGIVMGNRYYGIYFTGSAIAWDQVLRVAASKKVESAALGASYQCQGYLGTVETAQEQALFARAFSHPSWLGASDDFNYVNAALAQSAISPTPSPSSYADQAASEGKFYWINGPSRGQQLTNANVSSAAGSLVPGVFNNWVGTQPDNSGSNQHYAVNNSSDLWEDTLLGANVQRYIIEYGGLRTTATHQTDPANVVYTTPGHMGDVADCVPAIVANSVSQSFTAFTGLSFNQGKLNGAGALLQQNSGSDSTVTSGTDQIGEPMEVGDFMDYYGVTFVNGQQIDARATFTAQSGSTSSSSTNNAELRRLDDFESTNFADNSWVRSGIRLAGEGPDEWAEIKFEFFTDLDGTPVPYTLDDIYLSVYDIDSRQYFEVDRYSSYEVTTDSSLTITAPRSGITRFGDLTDQSTSGADEFTISRVTIKFDEVAEFVVRLGRVDPSVFGSANFDLDFSTGRGWQGAQRAAPVLPPVIPTQEVAYNGPLLSEFSTRTLDVCKPTSVTIAGVRLSGSSGKVNGVPVKVLSNTDTRLEIEIPAGLTVGRGVPLVLASPYGNLTHQNAFDIPAKTCSLQLSKGRWTQLQSDGKTVKMYAKDPVGDGKIQFFVDGKEIAWINAADLTDPKLSFASSNPYLVRSVTLNPGKNRFEIKLDGVRVWRTTYVPKG